MQRFDFFQMTGFSAEGPVKTDLIQESKYKLVTVGVEAGVTIPPCVMKSEMIFYVVEGSGRITAEAQSRSIARGDIIVVPAHASRSISAETRLSLLAVQIHGFSGEEVKR
jgi:quercetin dioxygenase-like cupin family protein